MTLVSIVLGCVGLALFAHALFSLSLMLYAWGDPERLEATAGPKTILAPQLTFTVLLPARGEEAVIAETISRVCEANYPSDLLEVIVICQYDDRGTIAAAQRAIVELGYPRVSLCVYDEAPFNKPHALTRGYGISSGDVVTIFDAEDDVHPDLFNVVNTVMVEEGVSVVQGGVQLMNFEDHWFSVFNCLEYFFYFQSRLHYNARVGMVPLGGNTVFLRREVIDRVGGWDIVCLTEDADIGLRISALGEPIRVVYDSRWVTREETPHSVRALVKQRTRWHQGFLQVLRKGDWRRLPGRRRRILAFATFSQPILDCLLLLSVALIPLAFLFVHVGVLVAVITCLPAYAVALQMLINVAGLVVFGRAFDLRIRWGTLARMPFTYMPYQWLLGFSAMRATLRHLKGMTEWEKTEHTGAHRGPLPVPSPVRPLAGVLESRMSALEEVAR